MPQDTDRIDVTLRPSIWRRANEAQRRELELLLREMRVSSSFDLEIPPPVGGWSIRLGLTHESLIVALVDGQGLGLDLRAVALEPLRGLIRSYLTMIDRMGDSISSHSLVHLEALDMARRSMHNEASIHIQAALEGMLRVDLETARRLFTVLCLVYDTPVR